MERRNSANRRFRKPWNKRPDDRPTSRQTSRRGAPRRRFQFNLPRGGFFRRAVVTDQVAFKREELPVFACKEAILQHVEAYPVTAVQGPTGSGKSTQIPIFLLERWPEARIVVSQPRRLAAIAIARRVAADFGSEVGDVVGYHIRGEACYSAATQLTFMTAGMLIQELASLEDSRSLPWDFVIVDEVHERSVEIDFLLVLFKHCLLDSPFKLILMSATLNEVLNNYFSHEELERLRVEVRENRDPLEDDGWNQFQWETGDTIQSAGQFAGSRENAIKTIAAGGRLFDVSVVYLESILQMIYTNNVKPAACFNQALEAVFCDARPPSEVPASLYEIAVSLIDLVHRGQVVEEVVPGSFLVFLPGILEINEMKRVLCTQLDMTAFEVCLLHSAIPEEYHHAVLTPPPAGVRRVILSTNIAESSITLVDIRYIIDFGYSRESVYSSVTRSQSLELVWAAKSLMTQRTGRAGRVANGVCYRLVPTQFFSETLKEYAVPEMLRSPIDKLLLKLQQLQYERPCTILSRAIDAPSNEQLRKTVSFLQDMGALDETQSITRFGLFCADMPCDIRVTRLCFFGSLFQCSTAALVTGAISVTNASPILSFFKVPFKPQKTYAGVLLQRITADQGRQSDHLTNAEAFLHWLSVYGTSIRQQIISKGHRAAKKARVTAKEREFCEGFGYDPSAMRDILVNYVDLTERLPKTWLESTEPGSLNLALAAAWPDKYLVGRHELFEDKKRNALQQYIPRNTVAIPSAHDFVVEEDLRELFSHVEVVPASVQRQGNDWMLQFPDTISLKLALWLGTYTFRHSSLDWVVAKQRNERGAWEQVPKLQTAELIQATDKSDRRDDTVIQGKAGGKVVCLARPTYPYRVSTTDFLTNCEVKVTDESVNSVLLENEDPRNMLFVASEYINKGLLTIGKTCTFLSAFPLAAEVLTLVFCRSAQFIGCGKRYEGFTLAGSSQVYEFNYEFTGKDVEVINEIRGVFATAFEELTPTTTYPLQKQLAILLETPRRRVHRHLPDWRELVSHVPVTHRVQQPIDKWALAPLDIEEDAVHWSEDRNELLQTQAAEVRVAKETFLKELEKECRMRDHAATHLVCKTCLQSVCYASNVTYDSGTVCKIMSIYGALVSVPASEVSGDDQLEDVSPENWLRCSEDHTVLGWEINNVRYISDNSPLLVLFPTLAQEIWTHSLLVSGLLQSLTQQYTQEMQMLPIIKHCALCKCEFQQQAKLISHVLSSKEHREAADSFLTDYVA